MPLVTCSWWKRRTFVYLSFLLSSTTSRVWHLDLLLAGVWLKWLLSQYNQCGPPPRRVPSLYLWVDLSKPVYLLFIYFVKTMAFQCTCFSYIKKKKFTPYLRITFVKLWSFRNNFHQGCLRSLRSIPPSPRLRRAAVSAAISVPPCREAAVRSFHKTGALVQQADGECQLYSRKVSCCVIYFFNLFLSALLPWSLAPLPECVALVPTHKGSAVLVVPSLIPLCPHPLLGFFLTCALRHV